MAEQSLNKTSGRIPQAADRAYMKGAQRVLLALGASKLIGMSFDRLEVPTWVRYIAIVPLVWLLLAWVFPPSLIRRKAR